MLIEALAVGAIAKTFYSVDKAMKMDEKALKKYAKAFEIQEEAALMVKKKSELADKRLGNVVKKKRAIIENTVPQFVEVYSQIQKIDLTLKDHSTEIILSNKKEADMKFQMMTISHKQNLTDKELVCGLLVKGVGKMIEKDSERYLSAASSQLRAANVVQSQAESIVAVYDAVIEQADRIAKVLMSLNALFVKSIQQTSEVIHKNGLDIKNYDDFEKGVLMTCVNLAKAMSEMIDIPVVDENGVICQTAREMIVTGENYINKMNGLINS